MCKINPFDLKPGLVKSENSHERGKNMDGHEVDLRT